MKNNVSGMNMQRDACMSDFQIILGVVFAIYAVICIYIGAPLLHVLVEFLFIVAVWKMKEILLLIGVLLAI